MMCRIALVAACVLGMQGGAFAQESEPLPPEQLGDGVAPAEDPAGGPPAPVEAEPEPAAEAPIEEAPVEEAPADATPDFSPEAAADAAPLLSDEQVAAENAYQEPEARSSTDPFEDPNQTYLFLGAFYRHQWTPGFMLGLFTDEYTAANNHAAGLELTYRKDGFDIVTSVYYQGYRVNGPFRGSGDAETETEIIDSSLFGIMASVDLLWGTDFNEYVGIQYGLGLGLGVLIGDLRRTEATPDGDGWQECTEVVDGDAFCDNVSGDISGHTGINPKWFDGGSVPNLYFRFAVPVLAVRVKPIHQLMMRFSGGFDIFSGFFTSFSASYGF
ncbi:MAG: hypothetical protein AAF938_05615 [Myxococcota bacterium]